jgi:hypothetical protein
VYLPSHVTTIYLKELAIAKKVLGEIKRGIFIPKYDMKDLNIISDKLKVEACIENL